MDREVELSQGMHTLEVKKHSWKVNLLINKTNS
jgi:hypothetical protein